MMTVAQISLMFIFYFRFAQMRPMTFAVCVNNMIRYFFFIISTRRSIIYALLYISATLNKRIFQEVVFG